ncbi:leucine-rich repeat-containing protein 15 [Acyrthosiphon pisum]|uniref:Ig-like domain-containing protein n=1 Tax=Acyrthosiphon pisum TaxID=7029 RepID=A0A8R2AZU3_ACYPI|nr:leucine-rich repeat-containing protein 15 [Acyrthosiphon pisum]|eukprot:XP_008180447.1 PREDICTED: leucine-rich repeat-containing protein 15-like [Acyrthosiphon pisum]
MDSLTIILTTIILQKLTNALDAAATVCDNEMACKCANNTVSCTTLEQDGAFILPYGTQVVHFDNVPIAIVNNGTFENGKLLREITWVASKIKLVEALYHNDLKYLDLSRNDIFKLSDDTFHNCLRLEYIDLSDNQLNILSDNLFLHTSSLVTVNLEKNHFSSISDNLFKHTINLKNLSIGNPNLSLLDTNSMANLYNLEYLSIQNCGIRNLNQSSFGEHNMYLYSVILNNCTHLTSIDNNFISSSPNIKIIEINDCGTIDFLPPSIVSLKNLQHLRMSNTELQPNCQNGWFSQWFNNETTTVVGYEKYSNFIESLNEINCPPNIYYTNSPITLQLTKKGIINCMAYGNPLPSITWLVPGGLTFHENKQADINISHHPNVHNWDLNQIVSQSLITDKNGSLHILRMLRTHIGNYTCYVSNKYGNSSKLVEVHLDSEVFFSIKINALLLGISSALGFLMLTILCCAFKLLLIRLNCIKKRSQQTETEMGSTEKPNIFPADV